MCLQKICYRGTPPSPPPSPVCTTSLYECGRRQATVARRTPTTLSVTLTCAGSGQEDYFLVAPLRLISHPGSFLRDGVENAPLGHVLKGTPCVIISHELNVLRMHSRVSCKAHCDRSGNLDVGCQLLGVGIQSCLVNLHPINMYTPLYGRKFQGPHRRPLR